MTLRELLKDPSVTLVRLQEHLGSLSGEDRVRQATDLDRGQQALLWRLAEGGGPLTESDIVPTDAAPLAPVPFYGQNNQPIYRSFQKVFYRSTSGEVAGYNVSDAAWFAGPGYYLLRSGPTGLYVDYTAVPEDKPDGWPSIRRNEEGLSRFVYGNMQDFLRRVYGLILIGRAYRKGRETSNYFVLARP